MSSRGLRPAKVSNSNHSNVCATTADTERTSGRKRVRFADQENPAAVQPKSRKPKAQDAVGLPDGLANVLQPKAVVIKSKSKRRRPLSPRIAIKQEVLDAPLPPPSKTAHNEKENIPPQAQSQTQATEDIKPYIDLDPPLKLLTAELRSELKLIWSKHPCLPSTASRRKWAEARNVHVAVVHSWFSHAKERSKKRKEVYQDGSYELEVGPPPKYTPYEQVKTLAEKRTEARSRIQDVEQKAASKKVKLELCTEELALPVTSEVPELVHTRSSSPPSSVVDPPSTPKYDCLSPKPVVVRAEPLYAEAVSVSAEYPPSPLFEHLFFPQLCYSDTPLEKKESIQEDIQDCPTVFTEPSAISFTLPSPLPAPIPASDIANAFPTTSDIFLTQSVMPARPELIFYDVPFLPGIRWPLYNLTEIYSYSPSGLASTPCSGAYFNSCANTAISGSSGFDIYSLGANLIPA